MQEARVSGRQIIELTVTDPTQSDPGQASSMLAHGVETGSRNRCLAWNPGSWASSRTVLIETETALNGHLDEVVIFVDPDGGSDQDAVPSMAGIDSICMEWIAGYACLISEAIQLFKGREMGTILVVIMATERSALGSMAAAALEAFAASLIGTYRQHPRMMAVRDESAQPDVLARYLIKLLSAPPRDSTRVLKHGGKMNLFGR